MTYSPTLSAGKEGFALMIYSRGWFGALVNWIFQSGPIGWLAGRKFMPWRVSNILLKPLGWPWVDGIRRFSMPITPMDALSICWALDFDDEAIEFFWAMQVSLMFEDAMDEDDYDLAMALKGLLASQGFDSDGERINAKA